MKQAFTLLFAFIIVTSCDSCLLISIPNHSDTPVYVFLPDYYSVPKHTMYDSTIFFPLQKLQLVPPGDCALADFMVGTFVYNEVSTYMEQFPSDTVHVFFFDPEVVDNNGWNQIRENYMVLKRYDLTAKDLRSKKILNALWPPKAEAAYVRQYPQ